MNKKKYISFIIGLLLLIAAITFYVYLISYKDWGFDLTGKGSIGDAIGGITAPVVGLLGALLVYMSFRAQVKANQLLSNQNEFNITIGLINELKRDILYLYDRTNWNIKTVKTPFLYELKTGNIGKMSTVFKRHLWYVLNNYRYLSKRLSNPDRFERGDNMALSNSLQNLYECYLSNYCINYSKLNLQGRKDVKLSETLHNLSIEIINMNSIRLENPVGDD